MGGRRDRRGAGLAPVAVGVPDSVPLWWRMHTRASGT